jgi:hypothetical protein
MLAERPRWAVWLSAAAAAALAGGSLLQGQPAVASIASPFAVGFVRESDVHAAAIRCVHEE